MISTILYKDFSGKEIRNNENKYTKANYICYKCGREEVLRDIYGTNFPKEAIIEDDPANKNKHYCGGIFELRQVEDVVVKLNKGYY